MLITFKSRAAQDLTMLSDLATMLLGILGKQVGERGIITTEEMPAAIHKLERAVREDKELQGTAVEEAGHQDDDPTEEPLHLGQRAYPLLDMLRLSQRANTDVMWGV